MEIDLVNPYVVKILIAARPEDTINQISKRTGISYGWVHKWVGRLAEVGAFRATRMKLYLDTENGFYRKMMGYISDNFSSDVSFYYSILPLFGIRYCFTKTDSVFIWTKGGYQIARYKGYYPIFLKVMKGDMMLFMEYCKKLGLGVDRKKGVYYSTEPLDDFEISHCGGVPVDSLGETVKFAEKYIYNFEPALEMLDDMYGTKTKTEYKEVVTNA